MARNPSLQKRKQEAEPKHGHPRALWPGLLLLALLPTLSAGAQTVFTDVTAQSLSAMAYGARGTTVGDCDNDGVVELFATPSGNAPAARLSLFGLEADGRFVEHQGAMPLPGGLVNWQTWPGGGPLFGDYDNDGDLDLFVPLGLFMGEFSSRNLLLRNDRGALREVGEAAGLTDVLPTDNAIWLDYDRDGFLDLYTGNLAAGSSSSSPVRNRLSRNRGDGTFEDATAAAGLDLPMNPTVGGSNGGMVAADFDGDGWTDLYVGVYENPNRLFLNDGAGRFRDATTPAIGDASQAFGVAVGDIDNDGDLDIFQAGGGGGGINRSPLLRNAGDGTFEDVLEAAGLAALAAGETLEADFVDVDNDADLDLTTGTRPPRLFRNQGDGTFTEASDDLGFAPPFSGSSGMSAVDYDRDGAVDLLVAGHLLHNNGTGNHWLHVELVGTRSNRSGIGARVEARTGDLRQVREILGGRGYSQDELAAHFGLGPATRVDALQVRWPSGQVDLVEGLPADQRIRIIEGQPGYQPVRVSTGAIAIADTVLPGWDVAVGATVRPALFDASARIVRVEADLSALGGPAPVPLAAQADGSYRLAPLSVRVGGPPGWRDVAVQVEQSTAAGTRWSAVSRQVLVAAASDLVLFGDAPAPGWSEPTAGARTTTVDTRQATVVAEGTRAIAAISDRSLNLAMATDEPQPTAGYGALRFLFHPGDATLANNGSIILTLVSYTLVAGGVGYDQKYTAVLLGRSGLPGITLDMAAKEWQEVVVPLESFTYMQVGGVSLVKSLTIAGAFTGTVYLDDIRLLSAGTGLAPPPTAVVEQRAAALPGAVALAQNYPNPFNSGTVIAYDLPTAGPVQLAVYNAAGQRVVDLVHGERAAGSYTLTWDGRDAGGATLASGVYFYVLRAGHHDTVRRLLLVR